MIITAVNAFELFATLSLQTTAFENALKKAQSTATTAGNGIKSGFSGLSDLFTSAGEAIKNGLETAVKTATAAITAASAAVVGLGKKAIDAGMSFDSAMSQVAATMGRTVEDLNDDIATVKLPSGEEFTGNLRDFAKKMGAETKFSATEAAGALNYMALAGYSVTESMEMMPNVLNLASAGGMQLQQASDMLTDTQKALGLSFERTNQLVDEMAKAASTGNTSVSQLGEAFLTVGGLAKEANGGFVTLSDGTQAAVDGVQEMEIAFTAMANAGVKGSEAGTHMRNMLLKLTSPTEKGTKAFEEMGISVFDAEGKMRSIKDIFGELNAAFGNMSQADKLAKISDIFNARDTASAEALLAAVEQDWDKIGESILNAEGAAQGMANTQLNNLNGAITIFKSALEGVYIEISEKLTPSLVDFVKIGQETLSNLIPAIKDGDFNSITRILENAFTQALDKVTTLIPKVLQIAGTLVSTLAKGIIRNIPHVLKVVKQSLEKANKGDIGSSLIAQIFDDISGSLPAIGRFVREIIKLLTKRFSQRIPELMKSTTKLITSIAVELTKPSNISAIINAGIEIIKALVKGFSESISIIVANAPTIIENIKKSFIDNKDKIKGVAVELWNSFKENFKKFVKDGIPEIGSTVFSAVKEILSFITGGKSDNFVNSIGDTFSSIWNAFSNVDLSVLADSFFGIVESLQPVLEQAGGLISWLAENVIAPFVEWAGNEILPNLFDGLAAAVDLLSGALDFLKTPALAVWEEFLQPLLGYTGDIVAGTIDLISGAFQGLSDTFSGVDWDGYWLDFENFGDNWISGADDISQSLLDSEEDINDFFNTSEFGESWNNFWQGVGEVVADVVAAIKNKINETKEKFDNFKAFVSDCFRIVKDDFESLKNKFTIGFEIIKTAVNTAVKYFSDKVSEWLDGIENIKNTFSNLIDIAWSWGSDIIDNFIGGLKSKWDEWTDTWEEFGEFIYDLLHHSTPEKGLLKDDDKWMPDMMDNFIKGITSKQSYLEHAVDDTADIISGLNDNSIITPDIKINGIQGISGGLNRISETELKISPVVSDFDIPEIPEKESKIKTIFEKFNVPEISDRESKVKTTFEKFNIPAISDGIRKISTVFKKYNLPEIQDATHKINSDVEEPEIPEISDKVLKIKSIFEKTDIPDIPDINIKADAVFSGFKAPGIPDKTANINYETVAPETPVISDITAKIKSVFESFDLPKIPDIFAKIKTVFEDIKSPEVPDIISRIKTVFDNFDIPDIPEFEDIKVKIKGIFEGFNVPEIPESKFRVSPDFEIPEIGTLQYTAQSQAVNATSEQPVVINELIVNMENSVSSDYDVDRMSERFIRKLSDRIDTYKYRNRRGVGGTE